MVYGCCLKPGHIQRNCRKTNGLCLACGSSNHSIGDCPFKRTYSTPSTFPVRVAPPALPAPPLRRNLEPVGRSAPLPSQQYDQPQRRARTSADHGRGQVYNMTTEASGEAAAEYDLLYFELVIFLKIFHFIIFSWSTLVSPVFTFPLSKFWGRNFCKVGKM